MTLENTSFQRRFEENCLEARKHHVTNQNNYVFINDVTPLPWCVYE